MTHSGAEGVAVCYSVLQRAGVAMCCIVLQYEECTHDSLTCRGSAVCCRVSVLQRVAVSCSVRNALMTHSFALCCSVLQCVASVLQFVAVC